MFFVVHPKFCQAFKVIYTPDVSIFPTSQWRVRLDNIAEKSLKANQSKSKQIKARIASAMGNW
jgi:hypothetical protein